ncbi:unnamed protein product [Pylaiella littoralis]
MQHDSPRRRTSTSPVAAAGWPFAVQCGREGGTKTSSLDCSLAGVTQPSGSLVDTPGSIKVDRVVWEWCGQTLLGARRGWVGDGGDEWHYSSPDHLWSGLRESNCLRQLCRHITAEIVELVA